MADRLWLYHVPAYCRRPDRGVRVPAPVTMADLCTSEEYRRCPSYRAERGPRAPAGAGPGS
jgi:hypothetical protein